MEKTMQNPKLIPVPFANSGIKDDIPKVKSTSMSDEKASWETGFPEATMLPVYAGGLPPDGKDFNGVLNQISENLVFQSKGGRYKFDPDFALSIGGYPKGATLQTNDETAEYQSLIDNNLVNFNTATPEEISQAWRITGLGDAIEVLNGKFDKASVKNELGLSQTEVVSQKVVTELGSGVVGSFENGLNYIEELTSSDQQVTLENEFGKQPYYWDGDFPKPVPAGSTPQSTGGVGKGAWVSVGDASLRADVKNGDGSMIGLSVGTLNDAIDWVTPRMFGAESYFGLHKGQSSSSQALQDAINYAYENGKTVTLGVGEKLFLDAPIRFKGKVFNLNGGILEVSPSYAGNVIELGSDDPALWGATDGYFGNFTIQTTKEDDRTATRAEKEGQYTGLYYDTTYRPVFNVQPSGIHINRPKIGIRWAGSNVDLNGWSTSLIHSGCSILGFEVAIQVDKTAGIVGENIFNDLMLYNQRTTPNAKVFKLEKGTSLILNNPIFWNDGAETFDMFDITSLSPMAMVSINGGYFESDASTFVHPQVAINGNLKITTKSGGGDASKAVIFQPNITGAQVNNLISCEPDKWIVVSGSVSGISYYYQSRPMYALASNTTLRFDVGDEESFKGVSNLTFSCWMSDTQYSKSYLGIQVVYSDGTQDNFSSAYVFGDGKNHLVGVSAAPKGLSKEKIPTRIFVTINTTGNTCKVGIPVLSTSSNMPLYNVPLDGQLSAYKWNMLENGNAKPNVRNGYFHKTANTTATKYTDFTGAFANQKIFIKVADSNTSIDLSNLGNLRGNTPTGTIVASYKLNVSDVIKAEKDLDGRWYCTIIRGSDL